MLETPPFGARRGRKGVLERMIDYNEAREKLLRPLGVKQVQRRREYMGIHHMQLFVIHTLPSVYCYWSILYGISYSM